MVFGTDWASEVEDVGSYKVIQNWLWKMTTLVHNRALDSLNCSDERHVMVLGFSSDVSCFIS